MEDCNLYSDLFEAISSYPLQSVIASFLTLTGFSFLSGLEHWFLIHFSVKLYILNLSLVLLFKSKFYD